ncbi:MAG: DUF3883 domain-containing protein [Bacteroidaceae bacterium]|nr:DUF3883 domain-containing protein [Bacteroidaceae bacterium]
MTDRQEKISEILNLVGYGMAKFDYAFIREFGCKTKTAFGQYFVDLGLANTWKAVSNRQDSFDPYFDNGRRGWYQRNQREHIKLFIDSLFGNEDAHGLANIVKLYIQDLNAGINLTTTKMSPAVKSKFKQLQETGKEAEFYFMSNYKSVDQFANGILEDARLWGDGYDFQIQTNNAFLLAEVKGVKENHGSIRLTQNEYIKAQEYKSDYVLVIVSNLASSPKLSLVENPVEQLVLTSREQRSVQVNYYSDDIRW